MARILNKNELSRVKEIDAGVKNKFKWEWLERKIDLKVDGKTVTVRLGDSIAKLDQPGKALCQWCSDQINYGTRGRVALDNHVVREKHLKHVRVKQTNYTLGSFGLGSARSEQGLQQTTTRSPYTGSAAACSSGITQTVNSPSGSTTLKPLVPLGDRVCNLEGLILGVLAENSLPFTMSSKLIEVSKVLASQPKALNHLKMDRTTASYKMRFGLAKTFHDATVNCLRETFFSLNIDEATSNNNQRVLAILVSYFSPQINQVVVEHLTSLSVIRVDTKSLLTEICKVFEMNELPWQNLMSVLMDSCSVMRGSKSGLEKQLREKAPHLLDIDGDVCHHIHNGTKKLCSPFEYWVEGMYSQIHSDFKWSADLRDALNSICLCMGIKFTVPEQFIPHRWLSCFDITVSTLRLLKALTVFYYSFLLPGDKRLYRSYLDAIYKQHEVSSLAKEEISKIQSQLSQKKMTSDGEKRKKGVVEKLFFCRKKTRLIMHFYSAVFPLLKEYVCLFETKVPLVHKMNDRQCSLFRNFLACFMKPEAILHLSVKELKQIDIAKKGNQLAEKDIFVGVTTNSIITSSHKNDQTIVEFLKKVMEGYQACGIYLQKKLPLDNPVLACMSALDPLARGHSVSMKRLLKLPQIVTNVICNREQYDLEVRRFSVDHTLPTPLGEDGREKGLDDWWASVFKMDQYPVLSKMVKALISCFRGPDVEGSFNTMGDIIDPKSARLNISTYSAIQTVKYGLRAANSSAVNFFKKADVLHDQVDPHLCRNLRTSRKRYGDELSVKKKEQEEKKQKLELKVKNAQSKKQAKELVCLAEKKARQAHKLKMKARLQQLVKKKREKTQKQK